MENPRFRFKYQCDSFIDNDTKSFRPSCNVCSVKSICMSDPAAYSEGEMPEEKICPHSGKKLSLVGYDYIDPNPVFTILTKMSKDQIKVDRKKRSENHFKKEIFPKLPKSEQIHFMHKYPGLKPTVNVHKKD